MSDRASRPLSIAIRKPEMQQYPSISRKASGPVDLLKFRCIKHVRKYFPCQESDFLCPCEKGLGDHELWESTVGEIKHPLLLITTRVSKGSTSRSSKERGIRGRIFLRWKVYFNALMFPRLQALQLEDVQSRAMPETHVQPSFTESCCMFLLFAAFQGFKIRTQVEFLGCLSTDY